MESLNLTSKTTTKPGEKHLLYFLVVTTLGKWAVNTGKRIFYPFAPAIARGLGINVSAVTGLIALNQATALIAPWIMVKAASYGHRATALAAFLSAVILFTAMGLLPFYLTIACGIFLLGLVKSIVDPTFQAMVGDHLPPEHRGKAVGMMEVSWSASTLIGIPVCGLIIQEFHWQTPFLALSLVSLLCLGAMVKVLPASPPRTAQAKPIGWTEWKALLKHPRIAALMVYSFCVCMANDNFFVTYGFWLEDSYGLSLAAIGLGTVFIGLAEILGELFMAFLADRLGMVRTLIWSTLFSALSFLVLLALDTELYQALAGLFLVFFFFEFSYVTSMGLTTEITDRDRGTVISVFFAVRGLGRVVGALSGGLCWNVSGIAGVSWLSGAITFIALAALMMGFRHSTE